MTVKSDESKTLKIVERNGTVVRVVRSFLVDGVKASDWTSPALGMIAVGVPAYGDRLSSNPSSQFYTLVVTDRESELIDEDIARVTVTYENAYNIDQVEDRFDAPFLGIIGNEVRCSVQQKNSNLDYFGNQVVLQHTYPEDDPNFPGETRYQGGEFSYHAPQRSFTIHGIKQTNAPWAIANTITGCTNYYPFSGEAPHTWLCIATNWKPESFHNGVARYYMRFEFQFDRDTWDPTIVYQDEVTGKPPPNLVLGEGIKVIQKLPAVDFEYIIGTFIHGA